MDCDREELLANFQVRLRQRIELSHVMHWSGPMMHLYVKYRLAVFRVAWIMQDVRYRLIRCGVYRPRWRHAMCADTGLYRYWWCGRGSHASGGNRLEPAGKWSRFRVGRLLTLVVLHSFQNWCPFSILHLLLFYAYYLVKYGKPSLGSALFYYLVVTIFLSLKHLSH